MSSGLKGFRVVIIAPENYPHSQCFLELAQMLVASFRDLQIDCDFSVNDISESRINVLLGYHLIEKEQLSHMVENSIRCIPYQLEQLDSVELKLSKEAMALLRHGVVVWDYSLRNVQFLSRFGISADYLPIGYHKCLEKVVSLGPEEREIDVLFYGSLVERRARILNELNNIMTVKTLFGVYGDERDKWISKSKMVLNIHLYSSQILESVRLSYLLNNRVFFLTETSLENGYQTVPIVQTGYDTLIERTVYYLNHPKEMERLRKQKYVKFKKHFPMVSLLSHTLRNLNEK